MKSGRLWIYSLISRLLPETRFFGMKVALLRWCGAKIGKNVRISSSARFFGNGELIIGNDVWIGTGSLIHSVFRATIRIGNCCDLGPRVMILTGSHQIDPDGVHIAGEGTFANVEIADGCWLGARSLILPGVHLRANTVVAAGAVMNKSSVETKCLYAGVPAEMKKRYAK
ncbi:MAG: acyltransferase [Victivallales bacterium]|nr:acyltransferase [Victivallales bacterium]